MATRKRGTVHKSPEEIELDRRERERVSTPPPPVAPLDDPPTLPPTRLAATPAIADFALNAMMAREYARLAREAGMLNVGVTDAQAQLLVMRGLEMGISPIRALNELYLAPTDHGGLEIVEEATLIRARVANSGLGVIEPIPGLCSETMGTVRAIRHDKFGLREGNFTYTLEDATHDGLMLKANWQSGANREALLVARATTKASRAWFSDVEGPRYTGEELGGGGDLTPGNRSQDATTPPPPPRAEKNKTAAVTPPSGTGQVSTGDVAAATDAGSTALPVAPPTTGVAAAPQQPPSPPPPRALDGPPQGASRQEKMAYYADVSRAMNRPWTSNVGMSRDAQPVPIITHGVTTTQITEILNYTVKGRTDFPRADEALQLVVDHLGTLGIDPELCPAPYCFFALSAAEAAQILQGLAAFARSDAAGDDTGAEGITAPPPENLHDTVPEGQTHSWNQANDYLEAVLRRLATRVTRAEALQVIEHAMQKGFYELAPDELYGAAADLDRLGKNPAILKAAMDRVRAARM